MVSYDFGHQAALAQNVQRNSQQLVARMKTYYQQKRREVLAYLLALDRQAEKSRYSLPVILGLLLVVLDRAAWEGDWRICSSALEFAGASQGYFAA